MVARVLATTSCDTDIKRGTQETHQPSGKELYPCFKQPTQNINKKNDFVQCFCCSPITLGLSLNNGSIKFS